jgi:hypothetical protein
MTIPPRQASPWPRLARPVAFGGLIDEARSSAYPGREFVAICEAVRAFRSQLGG